MPKISDSFRTNLRQVRERRGRSQAAVAADIGMDPGSYGKLETGGRGVGLDDAVACAAALDVPLLALLLPRDGFVDLAPGTGASAQTVYQWTIGAQPLGPDEEAYFHEAALASGEAVLLAPGVLHLFALARELGAAATEADAVEVEDILSSLERELERQRDEVKRRQRKTERTTRGTHQ